MNSFSTIIRSIGVKKLAELFEIEAAHVRVMRARNSIPPEYWGALIEAAPQLGFEKITYGHLRGLRCDRFPLRGKATVGTFDHVGSPQ